MFNAPFYIGWLMIAAGSLGAAMLLSKKPVPRGIRNNNPGNIRHGRSQWIGASATQTDADFVQFDSPEAGIRAMVRLIYTYRDQYGLNTISKIISRWAPGTENDTAAYIDAVSRSMGVPPRQVLEYPEDVRPLVVAIIRHENGPDWFYGGQVLTAGIQAGISNA